jgi:phenolic acid decarboxylase
MDFESADESSISNIRQDYTYEVTDHYCACINYRFRMTFLERVEKLKIRDNLLELEKKITELSSIKKMESVAKEANEQLIKFRNEYCKLMEQSKEDYEFYYNLLSNIQNEYNRVSNKKGGKNTYKDICKNILEQIIQSLIKYEKKIILLNDNIKKLFIYF